MVLRQVVDRFEKKSPICVMAKVAMENVLSAERLDSIFENTAERQENKELMFSAVVDIMGLVACKIQPSVHAGYQAKQEELGITAKALYEHGCFPVWTTLYKALEAPEFYDMQPGLRNIVLIIQVYGNLSVSFHAGYRFDSYFLCHIMVSFLIKFYNFVG